MYLQIIEQIKLCIAVGEWKPGDELPSIRQLAVALRVSVITVKRTYLELEREGVITTRHGKGSFVAMDPDLIPRLYDVEFQEHLEQAVRFGVMIGLTERQIIKRLRATLETQSRTQWTKEPV